MGILDFLFGEKPKTDTDSGIVEPDFSTMEMEDILNLRSEKLFIQFRNKLLDINNYLTQKEINMFDETEIDKLFVHELLSEINEIIWKEYTEEQLVGIIKDLPIYLEDLKKLEKLKQQEIEYVIEVLCISLFQH